MTLNEIRQAISSGALKTTAQMTLVDSGTLIDDKKNDVDYEVKCGANPNLASHCDIEWGVFFSEVSKHLHSLHPDKRDSVAQGFQFGSAHWDWLSKTIHFKDDSYIWFYLIANEQVQGVCLIYHPEGAKLQVGDVFYIEYIAVAPWNTTNPIAPRRFNGIGTLLIRTVLNYSVNVLKLNYGFNLHALSQAEQYYESKLGMTHIQAHDKTQSNGAVLKFYELKSEQAKALIK